MKGQLIKRSKGSYSIVLYLGRDPVTGKDRRKWQTFRGNKKGAEKKLASLVNAVNNGSYVEPTDLTLSDYLDRWLAHAKSNVAPKTHERYAEIVRNDLKPALGSVVLCNLRPMHIQDYYSEALQSGKALRGKETEPRGLSAQTVLHHHRVLREALACAVKWELLIRNPADAVEPPKPQRREMRALNEAQTASLLEAAQGTTLYMPVLLAVTTGMRRGEFLGLRWADVDLKGEMASVQRSIEQTREGLRVKSPKGRTGRPIALFALTVEALTAHRAALERQKEALDDSYRDQGLICAMEDGSIWPPDNFSTDFRRLAAKAGIKVRLHDLRHSHATQLLINGVHPKIVSERLGHSGVAITLDLYSHVLPGLQAEAARGLNLTLGAAIKKAAAAAKAAIKKAAAEKTPDVTIPAATGKRKGSASEPR